MEDVTTSARDLKEKKGAFAQSLLRNNKKIREDRALDILEEAEISYKRKIEDIQHDIKKMKRERDGMMDLSPTDARSLVLASDFKSDEFVASEMSLGKDIRNKQILLDILTERYEFLFGKKIA